MVALAAGQMVGRVAAGRVAAGRVAGQAGRAANRAAGQAGDRARGRGDELDARRFGHQGEWILGGEP